MLQCMLALYIYREVKLELYLAICVCPQGCSCPQGSSSGVPGPGTESRSGVSSCSPAARGVCRLRRHPRGSQRLVGRQGLQPSQAFLNQFYYTTSKDIMFCYLPAQKQTIEQQISYMG